MNELQKIELNILKEVIKVLDNNNLRYFAVGGTCLGAVRHNGFIPWDDDIDIAMPRKDYELFRKIHYNHLPKNLKKYDYDLIEPNSRIYLKIYDENYTLIGESDLEIPSMYYGPFIDIFPLDGLPFEQKQQNKIIKKIQKLFRLNLFHRPKFYFVIQKSKFKKLLKYIFNFIFCFIKFNYFTDKIYKLLSKYDFDNSEYIIWSFRHSIKKERVIFKKQIFNDTILAKFEDTYIKIPKYYDEYLKQDFSNYLELPPLELRKSEHKFFIDLNHPSSYYKQLYKDGKFNLNCKNLFI